MRIRMLVLVLAMVAAACTTPSSTPASSSPTASPPSPSSTGPATTTESSPITGPTTTEPATLPTPTLPVYIDENGFNDHSVLRLESVGEYLGLATTGVAGQSVTKFSILDMAGDAEVRWLDSGFYTLHDEWYWYRLLNGQEFPGSKVEPVDGLEFGSVEDIYDWARHRPLGDLPLDLDFVGGQADGRLYSNFFYDLALNIEPQPLGLGSLSFYPGGEDPAAGRWVIELEYQDEPSAKEIARLFELLAATVPGAIGDQLEWVIRSPAQEVLAAQMVSGELPYFDRIVRYSDLVAPGSVAVYNEGLTAGRLRTITDADQLTETRSTDILLIENAPDWLPAATALITSAPQTPLAHVNILARNRGIPNASRAGVLSDPGIQQAARIRAPVIVRATAPDGLEIIPITEEQYAEWRSLQSQSSIAVRDVEPDSLDHLVDLASLSATIDGEAELEAWRAIIGGKAAGFINLMAPGTVTIPDDPLAITVRPYFEHLAPLQGHLDTMLIDRSFSRSARTRYLLLEGHGDYDELYTTQADLDFRNEYQASNPPGTPIGDILEAEGFKNLLRDQPIDPNTIATIIDTLTLTYGDYAPGQGLRFRSSSSVEDIEGFNGAGLYDSNTGYLDPERLPDESDHKRTVERAIKKTWASYWSFEAFEERRRESVDHLSGGMGVLVHARFDDPLELSNGVFTFTVLPDNHPDDFVMELNVQAGDESVTNPGDAATLPEIDRVVVGPEGNRIERIASSTLVAGGIVVLDDGALMEIFDQAREVVVRWRSDINAELAAAHEIETLTIDFEFREMAEGWPALRPGAEPNETRIVIKQARTLEPGLRDFSARLTSLPIPRDVLARARQVDEVTCSTDESVFYEVLTDPLVSPSMGYEVSPLVVNSSGRPVATGATQGCDRELLFSTPEALLARLIEDIGLTTLSG